ERIGSFEHFAASTYPLWSRIIIPTDILFETESTRKSQLTLKTPSEGGSRFA
ncbi:hypothetical protein FCV25MIE_16406, partial [Fagus crenata]